MDRWKKPVQNQLALNVDAAFSEDDYTVACGAVLRDGSGMFVGAATAKLEHVADVLSAEAAALAEGLKLTLRVGCTSVRVQSDCLVLIEALQQNEGDSMVAAPILHECRLLFVNFGKFVLEHCNCEANMVAHELA